MKWAKKESDNHYYKKYKTKCGGNGTKIELINKEDIKFSCYIIVGKMVRHFSKRKSTLFTISVAENCCKGSFLN